LILLSLRSWLAALDDFRNWFGLLCARECASLVAHKAGIEVVLDVVFNHTDEGDELGPTQSFPGH
jgi:hypothetical protein